MIAGVAEGYAGEWELVSTSSGVSAMHMVITHTNKAIMFDATNFGKTKVPLVANNCRTDTKTQKLDCTAHAGSSPSSQVSTNPWCSSGGFAPDGTLVQTGGWNDGGKAVRYLQICDTCDWKEYPAALSGQRWLVWLLFPSEGPLVLVGSTWQWLMLSRRCRYATQQILPDGSFILIGGRRQFGYEFVPKEGKSNKAAYWLPLLRQTTDEVEDNLYPFVHLSTDGNLFVFANNRSILLDYKANKVIREFPSLVGGSRNYPASAMSVLLPINLQRPSGKKIPAEVLVCGGSPPLSAKLAGRGTFLPALSTCGRLVITKAKAVWRMEIMPIPRVMGDMLLLPNGEVLMLNGASKGSAGWGFAREPALSPVLYSPKKPREQRFRTLNPTTIPRVYHSTSALLPDGRILVAGSNTNDGYYYTGVLFPTELRVEKFSPPYLDPLLQTSRPEISAHGVSGNLKYGVSFTADFGMAGVELDRAELKVTMYAPPFTTHGYSMIQRLLILKITDVEISGAGTYKVTTVAPPSAVIAPPGYYMLFVVHQGVPSKAAWVHIQQ
ncbi:unnamed protein product [Spirodela intermedia]|uniref:Uncharacterized protein n=1 Tax=Spirodela intermedia TaxID=51605 RepID=A0A7I8J7I7_SPIIN|nr:unnamed protein product [Spirodela intermedia]CAA6666010.1 unnamed protein product [Spirodela intermedia]